MRSWNWWLKPVLRAAIFVVLCGRCWEPFHEVVMSGFSFSIWSLYLEVEIDFDVVWNSRISGTSLEVQVAAKALHRIRMTKLRNEVWIIVYTLATLVQFVAWSLRRLSASREQNLECVISGSHGIESEDGCLLCSYAVHSGRTLGWHSICIRFFYCSSSIY